MHYHFLDEAEFDRRVDRGRLRRARRVLRSALRHAALRAGEAHRRGALRRAGDRGPGRAPDRADHARRRPDLHRPAERGDAAGCGSIGRGTRRRPRRSTRASRSPSPSSPRRTSSRTWSTTTASTRRSPRSSRSFSDAAVMPDVAVRAAVVAVGVGGGEHEVERVRSRARRGAATRCRRACDAPRSAAFRACCWTRTRASPRLDEEREVRGLADGDAQRAAPQRREADAACRGDAGIGGRGRRTRPPSSVAVHKPRARSRARGPLGPKAIEPRGDRRGDAGDARRPASAQQRAGARRRPSAVPSGATVRSVTSPPRSSGTKWRAPPLWPTSDRRSENHTPPARSGASWTPGESSPSGDHRPRAVRAGADEPAAPVVGEPHGTVGGVARSRDLGRASRTGRRERREGDARRRARCARRSCRRTPVPTACRRGRPRGRGRGSAHRPAAPARRQRPARVER